MSGDLWTCPECAFSFDATHVDESGGYSCPCCAEARLTAELAKARAEGAAAAYADFIARTEDYARRVAAVPGAADVLRHLLDGMRSLAGGAK